jgi:hypothetical protein
MTSSSYTAAQQADSFNRTMMRFRLRELDKELGILERQWAAYQRKWGQHTIGQPDLFTDSATAG